MKKTIILCLSILMIALTGCKKDKNSWGKLAEGAIAIKVGETKQLTFTSDGNKKPQWVSDDENIATVDANGVVTGVRVGSVYVYVSGLSCKVTVTDDFMYVIEPSQDWEADEADVATYMTKNFGPKEPTIDSATTKVISKIDFDTTYRQDTIYIPDSVPPVIDTIITVIDTIIADTTFENVTYVARMTYEYEVMLEGQFANIYVYEFVFDEATKKSHLSVATMTAIQKHVADIETYLNNRYVESSKGNYKVVDDFGYVTYILNSSPDIIFSQKKITDK